MQIKPLISSHYSPKTNHCFIIAEAGVNHNGDVEIAKQLIDVASQSGANAVKFQTFKAEDIVSKIATKAEYQKKTTGRNESQMEMLKKLELDTDAHKQLIDYCNKSGIIFLSTPFDLNSIDLLYKLGLNIFKIPSGEITNLPYLIKIGKLKKEVILSTGMANLIEIGNALNILIKAGTAKKKITVLHCNTEYPTPYEDVNLLAMLTIKKKFNVKIGYSDHTQGIEVPVAAVSLGANVIEKHFTLDKKLPGPDHTASLGPNELKEMVKAVRNIEKVMGNGKKTPSPSEQKNKAVVRKSIVAVKDIKREEIFTEKNLGVKRPGTGMNPMQWNHVIGQKAKKSFKTDELIEI